MIELDPIRIALPHARETRIRTLYGEFYARLWDSIHFGWLAYVTYAIGEDVVIHRNSPGLGMSEVDCCAWVQQSFNEGPRFLLPLLEAV